jgi:hypothetical protein
MRHGPMEERDAQPVFRLNDILYYPHFLEACWVQPGAFVQSYNSMAKIMQYKEDAERRISATELIRLGATLESHQLWKRSWTDGWENWLVAETMA